MANKKKLTDMELEVVIRKVIDLKKKEYDEKCVNANKVRDEINNSKIDLDNVLSKIKSDPVLSLYALGRSHDTCYRSSNPDERFKINVRDSLIMGLQAKGEYVESKKIECVDEQDIKDEVIMHFVDGKTYEELKDKFGIS